MVPPEPDYAAAVTGAASAADASNRVASPPLATRRAWWADNNRLDRIWLWGNLAVWMVGIILVLSCTSVLFVFPAAVGSAVLTLFFVTIPSRVVLNLVVRERRRRYLKETIVCCITFCILCWVAYLISCYPNPYP